MSEGGPAERLGLCSGAVVLETGWDEDADERLRAGIRDITGEKFVDVDFDGEADAVLLWLRRRDVEFSECLLDAAAPLKDGGVLWALVPKSGLDQHIGAGEFAEAVRTAELRLDGTVEASLEWSVHRLLVP
ncbi:hypothetical protein JOF53_002331 [Crossiella equi]|uniref:DUF3052 domain-containing protein n=1 Tax=Crossiella equi TaxID=130796 RepID=A0ABS5AA47_9PSEU|nr:DUF3052 family protein [Crossiella equi]MBP2473459.1 hypothetical protein [Crossiella equi]